MRKHEHTVESQDPEMAARIKKAMTKLLVHHLEEIERLSENPIEDKSVIDHRSTNAGKHYLENKKGYEAAMAARTRRIRELAYSIDYFKTRIDKPTAKTADADPDAAKRAELEAQIKSFETEDDDDSA